ncbi:MAG: SLC13 family permease, partial [Bacteroidia bacterium]|nr:SLC13 family permease [Bacteroidia bacterium]
MDIAVLIIFFILIGALIISKYPAPLLFGGTIFLFLFIDQISITDVFSKFTNEALLVVVLLLVISSVVERTDLVNKISRMIFTENTPKISMFKLTFLTAILSAFLNNTAIVASFLGVIKNNKNYPPSKYLIPLVYAASLGGMVTLIGTSTNLIINGMMLDEGLPGFKLFDFIYVGIPAAVAGILYMTIFGYNILPVIPTENDDQALKYFLEAKVTENSELIGKSIAENKIRNMDNLFLAEIIRGDKLISPVSPQFIVELGDVFVFTGNIDRIRDLEAYNGLEIIDQPDKKLLGNLQEAIISHQSNLIGKTLKIARFRSKFDASVVAISRLNERLSGKLGSISLKAGDNLILAAGKDFEKREDLRNNFYFVNKLPFLNPLLGMKGVITIFCFLAAIICSTLGILSLLKALLLAVIIYLVLKFTNIGEIKNSLPFDLILLIGSSLGIAQVMIDSGAAKLLADGIISI